MIGNRGNYGPMKPPTKSNGELKKIHTGKIMIEYQTDDSKRLKQKTERRPTVFHKVRLT